MTHPPRSRFFCQLAGEPPDARISRGVRQMLQHPIALTVIKPSVSNKVIRALVAKPGVPTALIVLLSLCSLGCSHAVHQETPLPCREGATEEFGPSIDSDPSPTRCKAPELSEEGSGQKHLPMSADIMRVQVGHRYWLSSTDFMRPAINHASRQYADFDFANSSCSIWIRVDEPGVLANVDFSLGMGKPFLRVVFDREGGPTEIHTGVVVCGQAPYSVDP